MSIGRVIAVSVFAVLVATCGKDPGRVTAADFGDRWPLTVDTAVLACEGSLQVPSLYLTIPSGQRYALNGVAMSRLKIPGTMDIQKPNPEIPGVKMSTDELSKWARLLCKN